MDEVQVSAVVERLSGVASALEGLIEKLKEAPVALPAAVSVAAGTEEMLGRVVATEVSAREVELERKLAEAEAVIAELRASSAGATGFPGGRKTAVALMAKGLGEGVGDVAALDAALVSLSVEQRIAVKAEMLRAGLLG